MMRFQRAIIEHQFAMLLTALILVPNSAGAVSVTVGDVQHPGNLPAAIADAYQHGATEITIAPGVYDLPALHHTDTIVMERWANTTIHADGVVLIFREVAHRPLSFRHCSLVTWDGGTLRFVSPAFTQGRIKSIGRDEQGRYCDWVIDSGYPSVDLSKLSFDVVDQSTRLLKVQTGDWSPRHAEVLTPGKYRLHYGSDETPGFVENDWLVNRADAGSSIVHLDDCQACTIENVTLQNGGFATIFETGGAGGNHYLKCKIEPGPRPIGATEAQLVGCGADGVHSVGTALGPDLEDCVFSGVFLDDCIAIHGSFRRVVRAQGNTIVLDKSGTKPIVEDPLRISDTHGFFAQAICTQVEQLPSGEWHVTLDQTLNVPIDHAQDAYPKLGTKANDPNRCGSGYRILRCTLGNTRSRGILVKADNGLIDHCTIEGCGMSGLSIGPEFWWNEANYAWNVAVTNNTFRECCKNNGDQATVWVHGDGAIGNRNITIQNNRFLDSHGRYVLRVEDSEGVEISGNQMTGSFQFPLKQPGNVVSLNESRAVKLLANRVSNSGPFAGELVMLSKTVKPEDVQNNNATGIAVQP